MLCQRIDPGSLRCLNTGDGAVDEHIHGADTLVGKALDRLRLSGRVVPAIGVNHVNRDILIHALRAEGEGIENPKDRWNRVCADKAKMGILSAGHRRHDPCDVGRLPKAGAVSAEIWSVLIAEAV